MNSFQVRPLSLVAFSVFCATLTYWIVTLSARPSAPPHAVAVAASVSVDDAASLFGGKLTREANRSIRLVGILALREGAAAIVGVGDEPPRAISLGGNLGNVGKLAEVRARSIVVDQGGTRSEIFMPENTHGGPTIYVR
jgi:general secretion pathway protein C